MKICLRVVRPDNTPNDFNSSTKTGLNLDNLQRLQLTKQLKSYHYWPASESSFEWRFNGGLHCMLVGLQQNMHNYIMGRFRGGQEYGPPTPRKSCVIGFCRTKHSVLLEKRGLPRHEK